MNRKFASILLTASLAAIAPANANAQSTDFDTIMAEVGAAADEAAEAAAAASENSTNSVDLPASDPRNPWNIASRWLCRVTERMVCRDNGCSAMKKQSLGYMIDFEKDEIQSLSDLMGATISSRTSFEYEDGDVSAMLTLNDRDFASMLMSTPNPTLMITGQDEDDMIMTTAVCQH